MTDRQHWNMSRIRNRPPRKQPPGMKRWDQSRVTVSDNAEAAAAIASRVVGGDSKSCGKNGCGYHVCVCEVCGSCESKVPPSRITYDEYDEVTCQACLDAEVECKRVDREGIKRTPPAQEDIPEGCAVYRIDPDVRGVAPPFPWKSEFIRHGDSHYTHCVYAKTREEALAAAKHAKALDLALVLRRAREADRFGAGMVAAFRHLEKFFGTKNSYKWPRDIQLAAGYDV